MSAIYFIPQQTVPFTVPLMIVALGGMFSERSGAVNIALEGIMAVGTFTGILFLNMTGGRMSGQMQPLLAIPISTAVGAVFVFSHAYASINVKANQTISGAALNMFIPAPVIFMVRVTQGIQQIQFNSTLRIESVPLLDSIPFLGPLPLQNTCITTYLGVATLILSTLVLYRTGFGLRLCSCDEHPQAADAMGTDVCRMQYAGVLIPGVLGGLGGLIFVVPTSTNFNADTAGYGFPVLAVLIFGQWGPVKVVWASLFLGLMKAVMAAYSDIPSLAAVGIFSYAYKIISYVVTLIVLVFTPRNSQAPKTPGAPYDKEQR